MKVQDNSRTAEDPSSIKRILAPLLRILPFFGLSRFKNVCVNRIVLLPLCLLCSGSWTLQGVRSVWCLVGAPKAINKSNMAVYVVSLMYSVGCNVFLILGMFHVPRKMNRVVLIHNELTSCKQFDNVYEKGLKRKVKYITTVVSVIVVVFPITVALLSPPFAQNYVCLLSPYAQSSIEHWVNVASNSLNSLTFLGHHMILHALVYSLSTIASEEFKECDRKFLGLHHKLLQTDLATNNIRKRYFDICRLCEAVDDLLVPLVAVLLCTSFPAVCFFIHTFIYGKSEIAIAFIFASMLLVNALEMMLIMKQGLTLHESSKLCLESAKVIETGHLVQYKDITTLILFVENMRSSDVGITFLKLFTMDKSTIVTVFASLVSYLIVILQFRPSDG